MRFCDIQNNQGRGRGYQPKPCKAKADWDYDYTCMQYLKFMEIKTKREIKKEITRINCSALSNPALLELGFQKSRKGLGRVRLSGNHRLYITLNESWEVKNGGEFCWLSYSSLFLAHLRAEFLWDLSVIDFHSRGKSFSCRLLHCYNPRHYISREIS